MCRSLPLLLTDHFTPLTYLYPGNLTLFPCCLVTQNRTIISGRVLWKFPPSVLTLFVVCRVGPSGDSVSTRCEFNSTCLPLSVTVSPIKGKLKFCNNYRSKLYTEKHWSKAEFSYTTPSETAYLFCFHRINVPRRCWKALPCPWGETRGCGIVRVLLPPSSSDLWGLCGRRRRLQKQEVWEYELFNAFRMQPNSEVITVSELTLELLCFDNGPFLCVCVLLFLSQTAWPP